MTHTTLWHTDHPVHLRNQLLTCDARALAADLPDASIDLVLTDPVYENLHDYAWLATECLRVLRPGGHLLAWQSAQLQPDAVQVMRQAGLHYRHTLVLTRSNIATAACRTHYFSHWVPCIWMSIEPTSKPYARFRDTIDSPYVVDPQVLHKWAKPMKPILAWLAAFTPPGAVVWDPFSGSAPVPAACVQLGRGFVASELDPLMAETGRQRIASAPCPLPLIINQTTVWETAEHATKEGLYAAEV